MRRTAIALTLLAALAAPSAASAAVKSNGKTVAVPVNCTGTPDTTKPPDSIYSGPTVIPGSGCSGSISLKATGPKNRKIEVGSAGFDLKAGQNGVVSVKISRSARRTLAAIGRLKAKVTVSGGSVVTVPPKLTIKLQKPAK
jgi:hypothetical protein